LDANVGDRLPVAIQFVFASILDVYILLDLFQIIAELAHISFNALDGGS
jgi:hypothetical protein